MRYAKYGKSDTFTHLYVNGRMWYKVTQLGPWTHFTPDGPVTVQAVHTSVWTVQNGHIAADRHTSRQINMF
jgi:hypothetical protein